MWQGGTCEKCGTWHADRMALALYIDYNDGEPKFVCVDPVRCELGRRVDR